MNVCKLVVAILTNTNHTAKLLLPRADLTSAMPVCGAAF